MKLNMKYRYLMSIGFLVFGFVMQAADYPNVSKMGREELHQLKNYLTHKGKLVSLAKDLIGSYKGLCAQNEKALEAVQEYRNVEKILEESTISDDSSEDDEQVYIKSRKALQSTLNDIRSKKQQGLEEHRALMDKYFGSRDNIVDFYNTYSNYSYNARIAEKKSFAEAIGLVSTFINEDAKAMKAFTNHQPEDLQLQQCQQYCDAMRSSVDSIQKYVSEYKQEERSYQPILVAIESEIKRHASNPIQQGADGKTMVIADARNNVIITLYKNNAPIKAPELRYSSTIKDWLANPEAEMSRQGYNNPKSDKYNYRYTAGLVHAFSLNVDECIPWCGEISEGKTKDGKKIKRINMYGYVTYNNGERYNVKIEYFIDPASGSCFHRNLLFK